MQKFVFFLLAFFGSFLPLTAQEPDAKQAADTFLQLVDNGSYKKSWQEGSRLFQTIIPESDWVSVLKEARTPLGTVTSRQLSRQDPVTEIEGLPDGEYELLIYKTSFQQAPDAKEIVVLNKQDGKVWRVLVYQIDLSSDEP